MRRLRQLSRTVVPLAILVATAVGLGASPALATSPYGGPRPVGVDPYAYELYMKRSLASFPPNDLGDSIWKYSSKTACELYGPVPVPEPVGPLPGPTFPPSAGNLESFAQCTPRTKLNESDAQELFGVTGSSVDRAWEKTTGRPDIVIGNVDSGIEWDNVGAIRDLNNKFHLNTGELPEPQWGTRDPAHPYDRDANGQVDMRDWCPRWDEPKDCGGTGDPVVRGAAGTDDTDYNKNGLIDPEDLIFKFSNGADTDGNGYVDDISGWDTYEDDNDPYDEHDYGHGTGEAQDSTGEPDSGAGQAGTCPDCRIMVLRVGDSFIADVNDFAQAVVYATDAGATLIQSALGTLNNSRFAQEAIDYAYRRGVAVIASAADESAGHHNQPSVLERTSTYNAIGEPQTQGAPSASGSYLQFRGCTNYGAYITAAVPGNSCSSEAVGRFAGMAGLTYAAARNSVKRGTIADYGVLDGAGGVPVGHGLSAEEIKQLVATTSDDINNMTPVDKQEDVDFEGSQRYPATAGWDPFFGYGRVNANTLVTAVEANRIPPEADISSPKWFQTLPTTSVIRVEGAVAARRAAGYQVSVQWAPWSWRDTNAAPAYRSTGVTMRVSSGNAPKSGLLAEIDPAVVKAALDAADTSAPGFSGKGSVGPAVDPATGRGDHENRQIPDKFGVLLRLVVTATDAAGAPLKALGGMKDLQGIATKNMNLHDDPALAPGFPKDLLGDGAAAPRFADLDDDGKDELVVATSNGLVHAYRAGGTELPGWPVRTTPMPVNALPTAPAYASGEITLPLHSATLRPPAIGDLDRDGDLEVVVPDFAGRITAFDGDGTMLPGFPVRLNPAYSAPQPLDRAAGFYANNPAAVANGRYPRVGEALPNNPDVVPDLVNRRTKNNRTHWWALAAPSLGDIDPAFPGLEIVSGGADRHLYAWHADGTPVPGWPVMLRDPSKVATVNPFTREITQPAGIPVFNGAKIVTSAALGDLDGDGRLEVVATPNEQYRETPDSDDPLYTASGVLLGGGNDRVYAIYGEGSLRGTGPGTPTNGFPNANAFLPGWPAKVSSAAIELLPVVGNGPTGGPVLGNLNGGTDLEVAIFGTAGAPHLIKKDGEPVLGRDGQGRQRTLLTGAVGAGSNSPDAPSIPAAGGGILTDLDRNGQLDFVAPAAGLGKLVDLALPDDQLQSDNHLAVFDTSSGPNARRGQLPAFPREVNDLQFLSTPSSADVGGAPGEEILEGTAYSDVHAFSSDGSEPGLSTLAADAWPKFTGGWTVVAPSVGDLDGDGLRDVASTTREGGLFVWRTPASQCSAASWPEWGQSGWSTGTAGTDAVRPSRVSDLRARPSGSATTVTFTAVGDDGRCGTANRYDVRVSDRAIDPSNFEAATRVTTGVTVPKAAGGAETFALTLPTGTRFVAVRVLDADPTTAKPSQPANPSALAVAEIGGVATATPTPTATGTASPTATPSGSTSPTPTGSASPSPTGSPPPPAGRFHAVAPSRILDTREDGLGPVTAGADRKVRVVGLGGVPSSGVRGVVVNATVTGVTQGMDLQVYPSGNRPARRTSNLNAPQGVVLANLVTSAVGSDGSIVLSVSRGATHVVLDVLGWYDDGSNAPGAAGFTALTPDRRFDSRPGEPIRAGQARTVPLFANVPSGVTAAVVSVTALGATQNVDVALTAPGPQPAVRTSTLNLRPGDTVANLAIAPVDAQGRVLVSASAGAVEVVLDVVGFYSPSSPGRFTPVGPNRTYDTRDNGTALRVGEQREVIVTGLGDVPRSGVSAVLINVTSTLSTADADLQLYPAGSRPATRTSNLQVRKGRDVAVLVVGRVGTDGKVVLSSSAGTMDIVFDVVGWLS